MQHCPIFLNRKNAKRWEPTNTGQELGLKGTGSGRFKPPCPPPPGEIWLCIYGKFSFSYFVARQQFGHVEQELYRAKSAS